MTHRRSSASLKMLLPVHRASVLPSRPSTSPQMSRMKKRERVRSTTAAAVLFCTRNRCREKNLPQTSETPHDYAPSGRPIGRPVTLDATALQDRSPLAPFSSPESNWEMAPRIFPAQYTVPRGQITELLIRPNIPSCRSPPETFRSLQCQWPPQV